MTDPTKLQHFDLSVAHLCQDCNAVGKFALLLPCLRFNPRLSCRPFTRRGARGADADGGEAVEGRLLSYNWTKFPFRKIPTLTSAFAKTAGMESMDRGKPLYALDFREGMQGRWGAAGIATAVAINQAAPSRKKSSRYDRA